MGLVCTYRSSTALPRTAWSSTADSTLPRYHPAFPELTQSYPHHTQRYPVLRCLSPTAPTPICPTVTGPTVRATSQSPTVPGLTLIFPNSALPSPTYPGIPYPCLVSTLTSLSNILRHYPARPWFYPCSTFDWPDLTLHSHILLARLCFSLFRPLLGFQTARFNPKCK